MAQVTCSAVNHCTVGHDGHEDDTPTILRWKTHENHGQAFQGSAVLRAKIDMSHPNVIMWEAKVKFDHSSACLLPQQLRRDPIMYRILPNTPHPRTGDKAGCGRTWDVAVASWSNASAPSGRSILPTTGHMVCPMRSRRVESCNRLKRRQK